MADQMDDRASTQRTLFGKDYDGIDMLVVTPLQPIFDAFAPTFSETSTGWWHSGVVACGGKNHLFVKGPLCTHIEDVVHYLPSARGVLLLGFCGAYRKYDVGDLVSCAVAELEGEAHDAAIVLSENTVRMYQVPNFCVQTGQYAAALVKRGIDCVDMETFSVFRAARRSNKGAGAFHVVTDTLRKPFYLLTAEDRCKVHTGVNTMVPITMLYLQNCGGVKNGTL